MDPRHTHPTPDDYADWINKRIGKEVMRLRLEAGLSPYALAKECSVSDQALLNLERGENDRGSLTGTLARIAFRFGITLAELIASAERQGNAAPDEKTE